ncbi:MAG TPA: ABC-F family ATP-binding cassette domain-containing protein [Thermoanaerobaculia bacterium]|nr:ABC-F family ATP-binding cassette domain-containing protein [Thermoanaerobaculia bacterium]
MLYRFEDIVKAYGPHDVLQQTTWQHNPGEHVGLVGRNGAGKTTLFKLLLGVEEPDRGRTVRASGLTIGHVSQHLDAERGVSLFDFVLSAFREVLAIEGRMRTLEHDLADASITGPAHDQLLERYADLQHDFEHANGYTLHSEVERVLTGVGFEESEWQRPIHEFSGGQQNRAMLARVLLTKVDLLLLDEPTNHLDLRGIEFLEEFLQSFTGSYLLISHDRTFLNRTVKKIIELAHGKLIEYHGNYETFLEQRAERMELMRVEYERQRDHIEKTEDFIRRNIAGQKTRQAQSRRKQLARMDELDRPVTDETFAKFSLDAGPRSGAVALTAEVLSAGYEGKPVVRGLNLIVRRGERYAIMGPNGAGKSTVLKTFAGRLAPLGGKLTYGHSVQVGYYDQTLGDLSPNSTVLDEIWNLDHAQTEEQVRSYLARFSFFAGDVDKQIRSLSGGEKGRLALAKIMYTGGNLLLLDEPTNHLDVYTREALEEALEAFTGALIVVSHDRYFVDRIVENVLLVEDGEAESHYGNYSDLVEKFKAEAAVVADKKVSPAGKIKGSKVAVPDPVESRVDGKKRDKQLRKLSEELASIEKQIADSEAECGRNDVLLCSEEIYRDGEKTRSLKDATAALKREIEVLYARWDKLSAEREALTELAVRSS